MTCQNGHDWEPSPGATVCCPVCGAGPAGPLVDPAVMADVRTLDYDSAEASDEASHPVNRSGELLPGPPHGYAAALPPGSGTPLPDRYQLLGTLGRGGLSAVYKALDSTLDRVVAVKVLAVPPAGGGVVLDRFQREARAMASLRHPNIVQIYEVGEWDSRPYLVLEYCPGGTLAARLRSATLSAREAATLVEALACAVQHAHERGVLHRDIKPSNVLLDEGGGPKLTDFGLVLRSGDDSEPLTEAAVVGTPAYMAPEQALGRPGAVTIATDVYGLGAVLYECLTGRPPFKAATALETLSQIARRPPVPPRQLQPGLPRELEAICLRCLAKDPRGRYPSAADLAADLRHFREGGPVRAGPPGPAKRLWLWLGRARGRGARRGPPAKADGAPGLYQSLLDTLPMGVFRKDALGRFTFVNRRFCEAVGRPPAEALGRTGADLYAADLAAKDREAERRVLETGEAFEAVEAHTTAACGAHCRCGPRREGGPATRYVQLLLAPVHDAVGRPAGIQGAFWDVTAREEAVQAVRGTAAELARSNAELEQFAYVASHDLQEPLRMVANFCQLLQRRYQGRLDADADEFIHFAVDGATRMQGLIDDLLDYSRVRPGGRPFVPVDCNAALDRALENLRAAVRDRGAVIHRDPLPTVPGDAAQLTRLFQNLLGNALKFCRAAPPVVRVGARPEGDGAWRFAVRDNGIGIEPRHAERIFTIFRKLHPRGEYPGNGIGLAICKKVVEGHGGRIWVKSAPGEGSTFYFTLPAAPAAGAVGESKGG
jgi:PAS domain S-box-containing protein